jgi:DNA-binding GntR family transcriptional regulator
MSICAVSGSGLSRRSTPAPRRRPAAAATLGARVYQQLRDCIVSLELAPGAPVSEGAVCTRFGASRTPVRSAIARLQREGFLALSGGRAKRRLIASPLTAHDMRQLFLMVGALDGVAARLSAELGPKQREPLVARLMAINDELRALWALSEPANVRHVEEIDRKFHVAYHVTATAPQLMVELESLQARRARYVRVYTEALLHTHNLCESVTEHDAIIAAIAAGDADSAEQRAAFNHRNALERYRRALAEAGERGTWFANCPPARSSRHARYA